MSTTMLFSRRSRWTRTPSGRERLFGGSSMRATGPGQERKVRRALPDGVRPCDHASGPFHELDLEELWKGLGRVRVRQHVNPLRSEYQVPQRPIDWADAFDDPRLPLVLDLGCGPGRFLMLLHKRRQDQRLAVAGAVTSLRDGLVGQTQQGEREQQSSGNDSNGASPSTSSGQQEYNYLGIEIRRTLVERANEWAARLGYDGRIHYVFSNATINLASMMADYPGSVASVLIQFPDPHFKKRHRKRRIFQPELVHAVKDLLQPGGLLFLQSDVEMVSIAMRNCFEMYASDAFELAPQHRDESQVFFSSGGLQHAGGEGGAAAATPEAGLGEHARRGAEGASVAAAAAVGNAEGRLAAVGGGSSSSGKGGSASEDEGDEREEEGSADAAGAPGDYDSLDSQWARGGWLRENPIGVPTEREHFVLQQGMQVYRVLLVRR